MDPHTWLEALSQWYSSHLSWIAVAIFAGAYALIISEKIHRTIVALFGAMLMIMCGILNQEEALAAIDFNTIGLLVGMMIIVFVLSQTGLFNYLAIIAAQLVRGHPLWLLVMLAALTAVCSAFLDNVTTVLLTVPVMFKMTSQLRVNPRPYIISQIIASNIGGAATLIGDPPNIMIGSKAIIDGKTGIDFVSFLTNLGLLCLFVLVVTMALIVLIYRKDLRTTTVLRARIMRMDPKKAITRRTLLFRCLLVLGMTIILFICHGFLNLESGAVAMWGAACIMLVTLARKPRILNQAFSRLEWTSIFFFVGLFVLVGALEHCGVIEQLAGEAMAVTQGDPTFSAMMVLGLSSLLSAFVDNIPFVATMIPMINDMGAMGISNLEPLWWALSLGACFGGNGTIVGASANVVALSLASQRGYKITFMQYFKIAFPLMALSIIISAVYLYLFYL